MNRRDRWEELYREGLRHGASVEDAVYFANNWLGTELLSTNEMIVRNEDGTWSRIEEEER